jgi:hypothetical protein
MATVDDCQRMWITMRGLWVAPVKRMSVLTGLKQTSYPGDHT